VSVEGKRVERISSFVYDRQSQIWDDESGSEPLRHVQRS
jgi:hypothetical protein